jgi:hypothetical protein
MDVQLIGRAGNVVAEKQDDIDREHPRLCGRAASLLLCRELPASEAHEAARIRVIYHGDAHRGTS